MTPAALRTFLDRNEPTVLVELVAVRGSTPREAGAFMLVSAEDQTGTIGGGALEYLCIDRARRALVSGEALTSLDVPLGPEIGQCCGGRVDVAIRLVDARIRSGLVRRIEAERAHRPHVYVFGAGHVGRALARALAPLPLCCHVVDTRPAALVDLPPEVETHAVAMPEALVRSAPAGSSFVILTHDHALDFLIAAEALQRPDALYVGMVGSMTKRARFTHWYRAEGHDQFALNRLISPIGAVAGVGDKRPEVIAALAAAEILVTVMNKGRLADEADASGAYLPGVAVGR
jgi:xanthine dehydrogenase accessory factor